MHGVGIPQFKLDFVLTGKPSDGAGQFQIVKSRAFFQFFQFLFALVVLIHQAPKFTCIFSYNVFIHIPV